VARNKPYAGGHITESFGRPAEGIHALQIEMSRALYMNEARLTKTAGFARLERDLARIFGELASGWGAIFDRDTLAAE
jgi:N-formylglutamate amidohydrolase